MLITPDNVTIEYTLCSGFYTSNYKAKYDALLIGLKIAVK